MMGDNELKVAVFGLGYIGLPTAAVIARTGAQVVGIDVDPAVVETVNSGRVHIEEVDLDGLVSGVVARGNLRASLAVEPADVFVIAVPTPFDDDHAPNIGYVLRAATTIAAVLKPGDTVVLDRGSARSARQIAPRSQGAGRVGRGRGHRDRLLPGARAAGAHSRRTDRQ